jgi:hypothetical protein
MLLKSICNMVDRPNTVVIFPRNYVMFVFIIMYALC